MSILLDLEFLTPNIISFLFLWEFPFGRDNLRNIDFNMFYLPEVEIYASTFSMQKSNTDDVDIPGFSFSL